MKRFRIPNWNEYQHYGKRNPPWIKFHTKLLENDKFGDLPENTRLHLLLIWLLASRTENNIKYDAAYVAGKIEAKTPVDLDLLERAGFIESFHDASNVLAQGASLTRLSQTETEGETEGETEHTPRARAGEVDLFADSFDSDLQGFMKTLKATYPFRAPSTPGKNRWDRAAQHAKAHVVAGRTTYADILEAVRRYRLYCEAREQIGTQFVEMAGNFVADMDNLANEWEPPTRKLTKAEQAEQEQRRILKEMKERDANA